MMIIFLGRDRAELTKIKPKDFDKHFFEARKQAYRIFPDGLTRCRIYIDGVEQESEEIFVYPENGIVPHNPQGLDYSPGAIKSDIDFHKNATATGWTNRFKLFVDRGAGIWRIVAPFAGLIIAGAILGWAMLNNG